ncbi:MAG: hypothetical protein GXY83_24760 [Rhodopirellula sp.]|nr:hypothetical protein [Rhodopirellula sp.]
MIGNTSRRVSVLVATLCFSRYGFEFSLSQKKADFYRALVHALDFFGGSPRKIIFDNLKAAVLNGSGRHACFHPEFLALCGHFCMEPIACARRDPESTNPNLSEPLSAIEVIRSRVDLSLLTKGTVVIIGLGGIGSILAHYLLLFLASLKDEFHVLLCDGDSYEPSNQYRIVVPDFANKAIAQASWLNENLGRPGLYIRPYPQYLNDKNRREVIQERSLVCLAVDNHATRLLASRTVAELCNGVLISGGNDGVGPGETGSYGNIQIYGRIDNCDAFGAPLQRFHPEIANPADRNPDELGCIELAASGAIPQVLFMNLAVASAMCNAVWRLLMPPADERMYDEVCFDILDAESRPRWLTGPRMPS